MNKIKVKDEVILIAGKDKGSIGTVTKIADNKVVVEGLNIAKKHVTIESPFDLKNLSLLPSLSIRSPTLSAFFVCTTVIPVAVLHICKEVIVVVIVW
jgi:hypothetical protein